MKRLFALLLVLALTCAPALAEPIFGYRFADATEAAQLRLANREYFENLNQLDLNFRMQKLDATLEELEAFAAAQTLDFTDAEMAALDEAMAWMEQTCATRGYALPATDGIVFAKTTMADECDAGGYTHGTQIYLGQKVMDYAFSEKPEIRTYFKRIVAHELFHCLTRNHPDFRRDMYGILGFTIGEECAFSEAIREKMISNPDVEHHDAHATFFIGGEPLECVAVFMTEKPFEQPGDRFFDGKVTGLVPVDDPATLYTADDAENFWEVFGKNTDYVIDPEETLADNFSFTIMGGPEAAELFPSPEILLSIDALLKGNAA